MPGRTSPAGLRGGRGRGRAAARMKPPPLAPRTRAGARAAAGLRPLPGPSLPEHCPPSQAVPPLPIRRIVKDPTRCETCRSICKLYSKTWSQKATVKQWQTDSSALEPCRNTRSQPRALKIIPRRAVIPGFQSEMATKRQNLWTAVLTLGSVS
ncbi:uncharacterized protein LOC131548455 isoform X2 [Onychostoma macrolepis]|uniref:uncharacterized protein LOC131548455 isoform X2 n=1 Tax=Onychostoma macrolepis TaxID=369639 RepID=UPI0027297589|nr:uncharacterized protein LOC131548455 isoform X2 [Onychostoma macrolepis]